MSESSKTPKNLIFCTGFDVFGGHEDRNASWEAVKLLPDTIKHQSIEYTLEKLKIPVTYKDVDELIPKIWSRNPKVNNE